MNRGLLELSSVKNVYLNAVDGAGSTVLHFILMRMMVHHDADNLDWYRHLLARNIHFETTRDPFAACTLVPTSLVRQDSLPQQIVCFLMEKHPRTRQVLAVSSGLHQ